jgi:hypothetical protein
MQYHFANFVEEVCRGVHEPIVTQATHLLFLNPDETMERQVAGTVASKPTLVLGLDALFWSCYGAGLTPPQRIARFEAGLRRLEHIEAPLVVADIPDAAPAIGSILSRAQVPPPEVIAKCNLRLREWAAGRPGVAVFPLARLMSAAYRNQEISFAGQTWAAGKSAGLIRADHLHPSQSGLAALAVAMLETASETFAPDAASGLNHDIETVLAGGIARGHALKGSAKGSR